MIPRVSAREAIQDYWLQRALLEADQEGPKSKNRTTMTLHTGSGHLNAARHLAEWKSGTLKLALEDIYQHHDWLQDYRSQHQNGTWAMRLGFYTIAKQVLPEHLHSLKKDHCSPWGKEIKNDYLLKNEPIYQCTDNELRWQIPKILM